MINIEAMIYLFFQNLIFLGLLTVTVLVFLAYSELSYKLRRHCFNWSLCRACGGGAGGGGLVAMDAVHSSERYSCMGSSGLTPLLSG